MSVRRRVSPAPPSSCPFDTPQITQAMLVRYRQLTDLLAERDRLRKLILRQLDANVDVEPGQLNLSVHESERRVLTWKKLEAFLQADDVAWIRSNTPATICRQLNVIGEIG